MGLHDAPRRCKLRTASIYEANSNFHHISWSPARFRPASSYCPLLENAVYAIRTAALFRCSGVLASAPENRLIATRVFPTGRRDAESDIKREYQESDAHAEHGLPIASGNAALLRLRLYREVTNRYDRRYDQRGASKSPQVVRRKNLGATQLVSPCIIHICFSLTLSSLRKKCRMLIKLLAQGALKTDKRKWCSLIENYLSGSYARWPLHRKKGHV